MPSDDVDRDGQLEILVLRHGDVAKSHHAFESAGQLPLDPAALRQKGKDVARALRETELLATNQVLAHIEGRLAGPLNVQDRRILTGKVGGKRRGGCQRLMLE